MDNYLAASRLAKYSPQAIACVAWRFWLGALNNKGGRGQIGGRARAWALGLHCYFTEADHICMLPFLASYHSVTPN